MCGLVGMAGDLNYKHKAAFKTLLFFNTLRGADSTGVTVYDADKNTVDTRKSTVPGFEFIATDNFENFLGSPRGIWLGHGRFKTVGNISRVNAHPFEVRDDKGYITLFGAHNGTLSNKRDIEKLLDNTTYGTDSEALLNLIDDRGAEDALKEASGAWALTWWQPETGINLIRNAERPLYYAVTEDQKVLIWASEEWMIRVACLREDIKLESNKDDKSIIWQMTPDTLYSWRLPDAREVFDPPKKKGGLLGKAEEKKFSFHSDEWFGTTKDDEAAVRIAAWRKQQEEEKAKKALEGTTTTTIKDKDHYVGFEGKVISRQEVNELKKSGCDWCGDEVVDNDFAWLDAYSIACRKCLLGEHIVVDVEKGLIHETAEIIELIPIVVKKGSKR